MNQLFKKTRRLTSVVSLSAVLMLAGVASIYTAPAAQGATKPKPPKTSFVSGPQAKPPVEPGSLDAKTMKPLGPTEQVAMGAEGQPSTEMSTMTSSGTVHKVDFVEPLNFCSKNLVYTPVKNDTAVTKNIQVRIYNQSNWRDIFTSVESGKTVYPASYGINGSYSAYLYVWSGSNYTYDEAVHSSNKCKVEVTRVAEENGWVQLKIENLGTAYATQRSTELAPFPNNSTYTGNHYDHPVPGGEPVYRWFQVGTDPYAIASTTVGSFNPPQYFTGDL